jgi:NAD(P)-dependent dehydrogenase (short-subunit alcohol dehydrogenase family)
VHYVASKGGILSLTRAMALELAPYRIRVNAIAPGLTDTAQPRYGSSEAEIVEMASSIPLGRMAQPDEIARAAVFLASETAAFVTGQTLHVNGGSYLAWGAVDGRGDRRPTELSHRFPAPESKI